MAEFLRDINVTGHNAEARRTALRGCDCVVSGISFDPIYKNRADTLVSPAGGLEVLR